MPRTKGGGFDTEPEIACRLHKDGLVAQAVDLLAAEEAKKVKKVVVIIDEAHLLSAEQEEMRMLTNHDMDTRSPFACLLIGQPTLRRCVKTGTLAALDQRIALRYHLDGMDLGETVGTISHHLQLAGRSDTSSPTTRSACCTRPPVASPRAVNNLALQALVAAFVDGKGTVDQSSARAGVTSTSDCLELVYNGGCGAG